MNKYLSCEIERVRKRHLARKSVREFGAEVLFNADDAASIVSFGREYDGGPGSGNWGHEGRKGKVGGSAKGGGTHNRQNNPGGGFTSFSKKQKKLAAPHNATADEFKNLPDKTKVIFRCEGSNDDHFVYDAASDSFSDGLGMVIKSDEMPDYLDDDLITRILIPNSASPNYSKSKFEASPERIKNAKTYMVAKEADEALRPECGKVWKTLDFDQKTALVMYTGSSYTEYNGALRGEERYQNKYTNFNVNAMTEAISKSHTSEDMCLYRGISYNSLAKMFGVKAGDITAQNANSLIGKAGTDNGFMSCGTIPSAGYGIKGVMLKIFCPKGTEALYAEPFSEYSGSDDHENWNGETAQTDYDEMETIIQRGTSYCCTDCKINDDGNLEVEIAITGQNAKKLNW